MGQNAHVRLQSQLQPSDKDNTADECRAAVQKGPEYSYPSSSSTPDEDKYISIWFDSLYFGPFCYNVEIAL